ncbi:MAG TPA: hypothetical protein PLN86_16380 [Candidatus Hydrogenedentes bacterium]|nr:hypothetical protein [Candidatus Hydrogenedentota bacterium]
MVLAVTLGVIRHALFHDRSMTIFQVMEHSTDGHGKLVFQRSR